MSRSSYLPAVIVILALTVPDAASAGSATYIALGDSSTFGNDESRPASTMPNFGDQGFVKPFADFLGTLNDGVRPQVVNLAISGELSSSFLTGLAPPDWPNRAWDWNLHYPDAATSQNSLMLSALDAAHAAGNTIWVSLLIGGNDFGHMVASDAWKTATPAQQQAMFAQLLGQVAASEETILTEIYAHAPGAHVLMPGYYNTYLPSDPNYALYESAIQAGDQVFQQIAAGFGATYVDFYSVIHGHEAELTNAALVPGGHANQAGYDALARALEAAAVPEPGSLTLLATGAVVLLVDRYRRRVRPVLVRRVGLK
jgi:lysophospholipase L1-like esterase